MQYIKSLGYRRIRYDKRLEDWTFIDSDYDIMAKRKYGVLDKNRDYEIEELLNAQSKRVVIVPKGVTKNDTK